MRIKNETHWRTDHLAAIVKRVAQYELDPERRRSFVVFVRYGRGRKGRTGVSGQAPYHGQRITLFLARNGVDPCSLAHTAAHEFAHARGMRHPAMRGSTRYRYVDGWREQVAWAASMPVETQPNIATARPTADSKLETAKQRVESWQRKLKLADTYLKKWTRKVHRMEAALRPAAEAVPPSVAPVNTVDR